MQPLSRFAFIFLCSFTAVFQLAKGQKLLPGMGAHFTLPAPEGPIDLVVADTDLSDAKPIFLWCQGSLPIPLILDLETGPYFFGGGLPNFDYQALAQQYRVVVISMPHTPLKVGPDHLDASYSYVTDKEKPYAFDPDYEADNFLDRYVERAVQVLDWLAEQDFVAPGKVVVAGHSQGAKVATKVAGQHAVVTHLGIFGANVFGREGEKAREARILASAGKGSWEEADRLHREWVEWVATLHHPDSVAKDPWLGREQTFYEPTFDDLLELEIPIYLAYGSEDRTADDCDLLPVLFAQAGKQNLSWKRYPGLEHNFFGLKADGSRQADYDQMHFPEVIQAFWEWLGD